MIKEKPFLGTGLGSFNVAFRPYSYNIEEKRYVEPTMLQLHNDPLQIIVELGLIGFALCLIFTLSLLYKTYQSLSSDSLNLTNERILQAGILLSIVASVSHSLLSFPLHLPGSSFLLFIFIGLLLNTNQNKIKISRKFTIFFVCFGLAVTFFSSKFYLAFTTSSFYLNTAVETISTQHPQRQYKKLITLDDEKNCLKARKYTDKAMSIYSNDFSMHSQASSIYVSCEKNPDKHLALVNKILDDNPYNRVALETAALIAFKSNQFSLAKKYYSILNYLYPINSGYTLLLGHTATKLKDYTVAHKFYLKTITLSPNNMVAPEMIKKLKKKGYIKIDKIKEE